MEVAKLEFKLALSKSKIRKLKNEQAELADSKTAMETRLSILEEENLRLIEQETKSRRVIEHKDRLLEVISLLSSVNTGNSIDKVFENNLIGLDEKNKEVLGLLTNTSKTETQVIPDARCETTPVEEIDQPNPDLGYNGLLADYTHPKGLWWSPAKTVMADKKQQLRMPGEDFPPFVPEVIIMDRYLQPPFVDNGKVGDIEHIILMNLPPSVNGADIVEDFELQIGAVARWTMFTDENGHYSGTMEVVFVHPPDARRAYKTYDGMLFGLPDQPQYKAEVAYFINGQWINGFYQKEQDPIRPVMNGVFVTNWINQSRAINYASTISQAVAVVNQQMQETAPGTIVNQKEQPETPTIVDSPSVPEVLVVQQEETLPGAIVNQTEQPETPTIVDAPSVPEALALDHQETLPSGTIVEEVHQTITTTNLDDPPLSCEIDTTMTRINEKNALVTQSLLIRKQKINKRTARRKKVKKDREAASPAE